MQRFSALEMFIRFLNMINDMIYLIAYAFNESLLLIIVILSYNHLTYLFDLNSF